MVLVRRFVFYLYILEPPSLRGHWGRGGGSAITNQHPVLRPGPNPAASCSRVSGSALHPCPPLHPPCPHRVPTPAPTPVPTVYPPLQPPHAHRVLTPMPTPVLINAGNSFSSWKRGKRMKPPGVDSLFFEPGAGLCQRQGCFPAAPTHHPVGTAKPWADLDLLPSESCWKLSQPEFSWISGVWDIS